MTPTCPALSEVTPATFNGLHIAAVRSDGLAFLQCAAQALDTREFVAEFDRLSGTNLLGKGTPLQLAIDDATGRTTSEMQQFLIAVWNTIFIRLPLVEAAK